MTLSVSVVPIGNPGVNEATECHGEADLQLMKAKLITGLALAATLLIGTPVFAKDHGGNKGKAKVHAQAAGHPGKGKQKVAKKQEARGPVGASHQVKAKPQKFATSRQAKARPQEVAVSRNVPASRQYTSRGNNYSNSAYDGQRNYSRSNRNYDYGNDNRGRYAFASHRGWNQGNEYNWNGNRYRWYDNGWFIIGPSIAVVSQPAPVVYSSGSLGVSVQSALARQGYYRGPIDGIVGSGTRSAIAAYQQDNGLAVTGTITDGLRNNLGV
jgi:hypothetical protein